MRLEFHPAAEQELAAAVALGEHRSGGLGGELLTEVQRLAEVLQITPRIWTTGIGDFRCANFRLHSFIESMAMYSASWPFPTGDKGRATGVGGYDR